MNQFVKYNERILMVEREEEKQIKQVSKFEEDEKMMEHIQEKDTVCLTESKTCTMNQFVDDDVDKEYEFLKTLMPDADILNPTLI